MKKYTLLGELLTDYRLYNNISQAELAARMNVDTRTIIRWERNQSLIKPEKEEELLEVTFIPYQVIRNLNAAVTIPTYYDFVLRKYSLSERSNKLPPPQWIKEQMHHPTDRIRSIAHRDDIDQILRYVRYHDSHTKRVRPELIEQAARLLPGLNRIIFDKTGYYAGHCVIFPLKYAAFQKLKQQEITENQLTLNDFAHLEKEKAVYHFFEVTADCNENVFYLLGSILKFFHEMDEENYIATSITTRRDSYEFNEQLGIQLVWKKKVEQANKEALSWLRFYEGNFHAFLKRED